MKRFLLVLAVLVITGPVFGHVFRTQAEAADVELYDFVELGVGLPAVKVNLDTGEIGFFDSVAPLAILLNPERYQRAVKVKDDPVTGPEYTRASLWSLEVAVLFSKEASESPVFGVVFAPYIFRIGPLAVGIGISYETTGVVALRRDQFSFIVPLTYGVTL